VRAQRALTTKGTTVKINRRPLRLALALTAASAVVLGAGVSGAAASNGAERSSGRSHEAHREHGHPNPDAVRGHDEDDNPGRGRGHEEHGNGHGYGHGDHTHQSEPSDSNPKPGDDSGEDASDTTTNNPGTAPANAPVNDSTDAPGNNQPSMNDSVDVDLVGRTPTPRDAQDAGSTTQSQVAVLDADLTEAVLDQIAAADPDGLVAVVQGGQVVRLVASGSFGGAILRAH